MEFIITGATGFLGREITKKALAKGHKIYAVTRNIDSAQQVLGNHGLVTFIDLQDFIQGKAKINCKNAIHLAWADVQNYNDDRNADENRQLQHSFLQALLAAGVEDITSAGTCLEYGLTEGVCHESSAAPESFPTQYAKAKHESYLELLELQKHDPKIVIKWVRCFYTYGEGQRPNSLFSLVMKAIKNKDAEFNMSKGDQKRDYSNLDTLAHNILAIAAQNEVAGIINAGSGKPTAVVEFIEKLLNINNHEMKLNRGYYPYSTYEPHEFWADITKLKSVKNTRFDDDIWL